MRKGINDSSVMDRVGRYRLSVFVFLSGNISFSQNIQTNTSARDFVGTLTNSISFGTGSTITPDGFSSFAINPAAGQSTTVDQFIDSTVSLGGGQNIVFRQGDATLLNTALTPTTPIPDLANASLTGFTSLSSPGLLPFSFNLFTRMSIDQSDVGGADGNLGGMNIDIQTRFTGQGFNQNTPRSGYFITLGLNTGINPNIASGFGSEWNRQAFP